MSEANYLNVLETYPELHVYIPFTCYARKQNVMKTNKILHE